MLQGKDLILATRPFANEVRWKSWWHLFTTLVVLSASYAIVFLSPSLWIKAGGSLLMALTLARFFVIYHDYLHHAILQHSKVAKARIYFRKAGEDFYNYVDMVFLGLNYCGTVPAPREGRIKTLEYYIQAIDDQFQPQRTSTFQMAIQPEGMCEFPPREDDAKRAASIRVFASNKKQGNKLPDDFVTAGVTFVPVAVK